MKVCEFCGKSFDQRTDEITFTIDYSHLSYRNFVKTLCADCAISAIEDEVDGVYFETCERCGKQFDYILDAERFGRYNYDKSLMSTWDDQILCCDCAEAVNN